LECGQQAEEGSCALLYLGELARASEVVVAVRPVRRAERAGAGSQDLAVEGRDRQSLPRGHSVAHGKDRGVPGQHLAVELVLQVCAVGRRRRIKAQVEVQQPAWSWAWSLNPPAGPSG